MTITLTVTGGQPLVDLVKDVRRLTGRARGQLTTSAGSVVLSDDLAHVYLCTRAASRAVSGLRITIHPSTGDLNVPNVQAMPGLIRQLRDLAGGDGTRVQSGRGGVVVDQQLACAYLTWRLSPAGTHGLPNPPRGLAPLTTAVVDAAEERSGLTGPDDAPTKPRKQTRPKAT